MAICPACEAEIEVDEFDVDKGDQLSCPECGEALEVINLSPVELDVVSDEDDDEGEVFDDEADEGVRRRRRRIGRLGGMTRATATSTAGREAHRDARLAAKARRLETLLADLESVVVAFSGGVDSAYLAAVAARVLGARALAVTADSPSYPAHHRQLALAAVARFGFAHEFVRTGEMEQAEYRANEADRCYHCKHELYTQLTRLAADRGFRAVVDGSNADDRGDYRPGRRAAREFGVRSPLDEVDLTKAEIRELARQRRPADLGRARVGLPVVAHPVPQRGHRREAARHRGRRDGAARPRLPRLPRAPPRRGGAPRDRRRRAAPAPSTPRCARASSRP